MEQPRGMPMAPVLPPSSTRLPTWLAILLAPSCQLGAEARDAVAAEDGDEEDHEA